MNRRSITTLLFVVLSSFVVHSAEKNSLFFVCDRQKEVRWLRVFSTGDGKCRATYSKDGYVQVVSSATFYASCEAVLLNVKKNIEEGGFKCREGKLASVIEIN